jgi:hypothetical protein
MADPFVASRSPGLTTEDIARGLERWRDLMHLSAEDLAAHTKWLGEVLEHDAEKWEPVFGTHHAPTIS